jgi:nucleoporin SEH1
MNLAQWANASTLPLFGDGLGVTCLSWSTGRFEPPTLVAAGSQAFVYRYSEVSRQWNSVLVFPPPPEGNVWDICWAPNVGRRFHYIAAAEGRQIRIFKLSRGSGAEDDNGEDSLKVLSTQTIKLPTPCWRVQWNVTGTVLATSGDKGAVQLWKADFEGNFQCVSHIKGDLSKVAMDA